MNITATMIELIKNNPARYNLDKRLQNITIEILNTEFVLSTPIASCE